MKRHAKRIFATVRKETTSASTITIFEQILNIFYFISLYSDKKMVYTVLNHKPSNQPVHMHSIDHLQSK